MLFLLLGLSCTKEETKAPITEFKSLEHDFSSLDFPTAKAIAPSEIVYTPNLYSLKLLKKKEKGPIGFTTASVLTSSETKTTIQVKEAYKITLPTSLLIATKKNTSGYALALQNESFYYILLKGETAIDLRNGEEGPTPPHLFLEAGQAGTSLSCKGKEAKILIREEEKHYLVLSYAKRLERIKKKNCSANRIQPEIKQGADILIPYLGYYRKAKATHIEFGIVEANFFHAGKRMYKKIPLPRIEVP